MERLEGCQTRDTLLDASFDHPYTRGALGDDRLVNLGVHKGEST